MRAVDTAQVEAASTAAAGNESGGDVDCSGTSNESGGDVDSSGK